MAALAAPAAAQVSVAPEVGLSNAAASLPTVLLVEIEPPARPADAAAARAKLSDGLRKVVDEVAAKVGVPAGLLHAVIEVESRYDPSAVSPRGAVGLMQLMPATAQRFGVQDPYSPRENVLGGAQYLKWLMESFAGDVELVLAAYNAGEGAVQRAGWRVPPFAETRAYVTRVMALVR